MAEIVKPTEQPEWASSNPAGILSPSNSKKGTGWAGPPEKPPFQFFNWFQNLVWKWVLWLEEKSELVFGGKSPTNIGIAGGIITPTGTQHSIDTEGLAASDTLTNLLQTNLSEGRIVVLNCVSNLRPITIQNNASGAGKLLTVNGLNAVLDDPKNFIAFIRVGNVWKEYFRNFQSLLLAVNETASGFEPVISNLAWGSVGKKWNLFANKTITNELDTNNIGDVLQIGGNNASAINQLPPLYNTGGLFGGNSITPAPLLVPNGLLGRTIASTADVIGQIIISNNVGVAPNGSGAAQYTALVGTLPPGVWLLAGIGSYSASRPANYLSMLLVTDPATPSELQRANTTANHFQIVNNNGSGNETYVFPVNLIFVSESIDLFGRLTANATDTIQVFFRFRAIRIA